MKQWTFFQFVPVGFPLNLFLRLSFNHEKSQSVMNASAVERLQYVEAIGQTTHLEPVSRVLLNGDDAPVGLRNHQDIGIGKPVKRRNL